MPIRETFWNIPAPLQISTYLLGLIAVAIMVYGIWRRTRVWMRGRPASTLDHPLQRLRGVLVDAVLQKRTLTQLFPGVMHKAIFWGMIMLFTGTVLATIDWDGTHLFFGFQFLEGAIYVTYELVLDIFGLLLLTGLGMAAWRRYVRKPTRFDNALKQKYRPAEAYVLGILALIAVTGYIIEALRIAVLQPWWAPWSPVGNALAGVLIGLGDPTNETLHISIWVFHELIAFTFIAALAFTKFSHIVTSPLNIFFRNLQPVGALEPVRNIEEAETFGAGKIEDWTWQRLLNFDACMRCGRCHAACPATATGKPLSPQNVMIKLADYLWQSPLATGKKDAALPAMHGDVVTADELWDCTTCAACVSACPVYIDQMGAIVEMRRYLTMAEGDVSRNLNMAMTSMEQNGNPYGQNRSLRTAWAEGLGVMTMAETGGEADVLYWVGCAAAYDDRNKRVARAFVKIMQAAGVRFATLGTEESCNGESARRAGNEYLYQMLAQANIETLNRYKVKRIVTACPHCFNTLKNEYPQFGGNYEVLHHSQFISELLAQGKLKLGGAPGAAVAYHDPCYLGRHNDVYAPGRDVLRQATDQAVVELPRHHSNSFCCGAGGGRNWMEENRGTRINQNRASEAIASGAPTLGVACPFCMGMLSDGLKARAAAGERQMEIRDVAEIVAERLAA